MMKFVNTTRTIDLSARRDSASIFLSKNKYNIKEKYLTTVSGWCILP